MASSDDALLRAIGEKSNVRRVPGYFRGMDGYRAIVDFGGSRVPADIVMDTIPPVNEPIDILLIDNRDPVVLGYAISKPGIGTVTAVGDVSATVSTSIGDVDAGMLALVNVGDQVILIWNELGATILGPRVTTAPAPVDPGGPGGGAVEHVQVFTAIESGSYRGRWWTTQVRAGDTNQGVWTPGTKIPDTIPASAVILSVEVYQSIASTNNVPANFALHGYRTLNGLGQPLFGPQAAIGIRSGWVPLPTSWGDLLKYGGGFLGVGVNHGGDTIFNPVAVDGQSGALRIRYRS